MIVNPPDIFPEVQLVFVQKQNEDQDSDDEIQNLSNRRYYKKRKSICLDQFCLVSKDYEDDDNDLNPEVEENTDNTRQVYKKKEENKQKVIDGYKGKDIQMEVEQSLKEEEDNISKNNELTNIVQGKQEKEEQANSEKKDYTRAEHASLLDKVLEKSLEELKEFKANEDVDLATKILNDSDDDTLLNNFKGEIINNYYVLRDILNLDNFPSTEVAEYTNIFKEKEESVQYSIRGMIFRIFNEPRENYMIKYKQKPIFKTFILGQKRKRKSMDDLMRKKYKVHACNEVLSILNSELKKLNIKKKFKLPKSMKNDVTKKGNIETLKMSLRDVLVKRYSDKNTKIEDDDCILIRENNQKILKKLSKKGGNAAIDSILNTKMENIYGEYYESEQFNNLIKISEKHGNSYEYNYDFKNTSKNFVNFYTKKKGEKNN